jgi:hypothetical protein
MFSAALNIFQDVNRSTICIWFSTYGMYTIVRVQQICVDNKQKSYKIMRINMFGV